MKSNINIKVKNKENNLRIDVLLSNQSNKLSRSRVKGLILQNNLRSNSFNLDEIKSYYYFKSSRWDLNKEDNITIKLPFSNYEQSLKQYKILENEGKIYKNSIVDLRVPKKIIISYK